MAFFPAGQLVEAGFAADVEIAAQVDGSAIVPVLVGESFRSADDLEFPAPQLRRVGHPGTS